MAAVAEPPPPGVVPAPAGLGFPHVDLTLIQVVVEQAATDPAVAEDAFSEAELIDQIAQLEALQHSLAALQSSRVRAFARTHVAARTAAGAVEPEKLERGVAAQIGLACRISPSRGRERVRMGRDLHAGLDHVRGLFAAGELGTDKVAAVVTATAELDARERAEVDRRLAGHRIDRLGLGRLRDLARRLAAEVAPDKFRARADAARADRRVTLRPAPDGMSYLTAYLPVEQGVAALAALHRAVTEMSVRPEPLTRSRGQIMADTLVERLTGKATASGTDVEIQVLVPVEALIDPDSPLPAEIPGYGPVPADLLATLTGRTTLRRLITRAGVVIGGDSRSRTFTGLLADLIRARDRHRCSEPYCDAPVRHIDHVTRAADGGRTEFDNGRAVCELHNYVREQPGWTVERRPDGVHTTTPTGHTYPDR